MLLGIGEQLDAFLPLGADTRQLTIELPRPILLVGGLLFQLGDGLLGALLDRVELVQLDPRRSQPLVPLVDLPLQHADVLLALAEKVGRGRQIDEGRRAVQRPL